jgi:hypothetical protein
LLLSIRKKFGISLIAFTALALLSWLTLSNDPIPLRDSVLGFEVEIRFRTAALAVLGLMAVLTTFSFWRTTIEERREATSQQD